MATSNLPAGFGPRVVAFCEQLRAEGVYRILTPDERVEQGLDNLVLHPLAGGMPVEEGWRSLQLFCEQVLPRLGS